MSESQRISFQCTLPSSIKMLVKWTWSCGSDTNRKPTTAGSSRSILRFYATKDDDKTQCSCRAESLSNETYNEMSNRLNIAVYCEYLSKSKDVIQCKEVTIFFCIICKKKKEKKKFLKTKYDILRRAIRQPKSWNMVFANNLRDFI